MADETTSTETSAETTTEAAATEVATTAAATATEGKTEAATEAAETTALGNAGETTETTEAKEGETEGAETKEAKAADVPETYELAVPEGFEKLDDQAVAAATPVFKELGLSNEQANKLVPVAADFAKRIVDERDQQLLGTIAEQRKSWLEEAKADKEIGGANWDGTLSTAAKALDTLGFPKGSPLRNLLDESGLGNHPEMIRAFAKVGKAIGEDPNFPRGDAGGKVAKTAAEQFYGPAFTNGANG